MTVNVKSKYNKFPAVDVKGFEKEVFTGYDAIATQLAKGGDTLVVDCYPGMYDEEVLGALEAELKPSLVIRSEDIFYDGDTLTEMMKAHLTEDRVRGVMYYGKLLDFVNQEQLEKAKAQVKDANGKVLIYGVGASLITTGDTLVYADLARWEIQMRYRKGMPNFKQKNYDEEALKKYKRGYFIEWRIADKHKRELFDKVDYWLDTNKENQPKMITKAAFQEGMKQTTAQPFRTVPYFDPGVWGGQWMKEVCDLDRKEENFAWSFDGVPEENSLLMTFGDVCIEMPSQNVVLYRPLELLGPQVYARFGEDFPIRFDFLDTMGGQNLSLQVHPTYDFIKKEYGMPYTQEESYYILDAKPGAKVYLGVKNGIDKDAMEHDLERANRGEITFPAEKYINMIDAKTHDHFLIPPGTIHCSGSETMVLEISSSAYIFTFKLWDWDRVGMDGVPRPIHIEEGKQVINYGCDTDFTMNELVNHFQELEKTDTYTEEKTGLHPLEYIETRRFTMSDVTTHNTEDNVNMLNLVGGDQILVESPTNSFEPYLVNYAETFIIPAAVGTYTMRPYGLSEGKEVKVLKAYVRTPKA